MGASKSTHRQLFEAATRGKGVDVLADLVKQGARPDAFRDTSGRTAFVVCAQKKDSERVQFLVSVGADPGVVQASGYTVFLDAAWDVEMIRCLVECVPGAGVHFTKADSNGWTPLAWTTSGDQYAVCAEELLALPEVCSAEHLSKVDSGGRTVLQWAKSYGCRAVEAVVVQAMNVCVCVDVCVTLGTAVCREWVWRWVLTHRQV